MHSMHKIVSRVTRAMGTRLSVRASAYLDGEEYNNLVQLDAEVGDYVTARLYKRDAQVVATFRKLEGLPTGINLQTAAVDSFHRCEAICKDTNNRWATYSNWFERGFYGDLEDLKLFEHLTTVRKLIGDVLGPIPQDLVPRFSSGSTFNDRGDRITVPHKISSRPTVTVGAWQVVKDLWRHTAWERAVSLTPEETLGNRFTTVPKDSRKDRGICVEPSLNVTYQLPVGGHISKMLRNIGIYIKSQDTEVTSQVLHRELAKQASVDRLRATIDMSNASDTVAYMLVKTLLPNRWFDLLNSLRSPYTYIGGKWHKNHKFSSMGNGFTFELETLIFWALAKSVVKEGELVSCYGDDLIIPVKSDRCVRNLLALAGFEVNTKKSFSDPSCPFRESCGGDFWDGHDVRPVFFKTIPSQPHEWMVLANLINRIRHNFRRDPDVSQSLLRDAWLVAINEIPRQFRVYGPHWAGDAVIHCEDPSRWRTRPAVCRLGLDRGYMELKVLATDNRVVGLGQFHSDVQLASALLAVPSTGAVPRDSTRGFKTVWRPTVM